MSDPTYVPGAFSSLDTRIAHVVEECGEVLAAAGKLQRFGAASVNPLLPVAEQETNLAWLSREVVDLSEATSRFLEAILGPVPVREVDAERQQLVKEIASGRAQQVSFEQRLALAIGQVGIAVARLGTLQVARGTPEAGRFAVAKALADARGELALLEILLGWLAGSFDQVIG